MPRIGNDRFVSNGDYGIFDKDRIGMVVQSVQTKGRNVLSKTLQINVMLLLRGCKIDLVTAGRKFGHGIGKGLGDLS
jgi:hypothetical protein